VGALYVVGPVLAWILGGLAALSLYFGPAIRDDLRATGPVPPLIWAWILGLRALLVPMVWHTGLRRHRGQPEREPLLRL